VPPTVLSPSRDVDLAIASIDPYGAPAAGRMAYLLRTEEMTTYPDSDPW
jgi:hypothetical protein